MVSFDIVSLYPNIPLPEAIQAMTNWLQTSKITESQMNTLIDATRLLLTQSEKIGDILDSESRISAIKCNEYKSVVQEITHVPSLLGRPPIVKTKVNCPIKSISLIIGGVAALPKEFPHMAVLGFEAENHTVWFCGGSLISEVYVLTAAHCIKDIPVNKIRLGVIELDTVDQNVTATDFYI